jgi:hypothetical protein
MLLSLAFLPFLFVTCQDVTAPPADDLRTTYHNLKAAEEKKDVDLIKKYAVATSALARKAIASEKPARIDEIEPWEAQVALAKEVEPYADYALYVAALHAVHDHTKVIDLFDTLSKQSPDSKYVPQMYAIYVGALAQGPGGANKAYEFASKAIAKDSGNEDLLLVLADGAMARKQWERAATYGSKLASVMSGHARPEGIPTGDWERKRTAMLSRGYYIAGISYVSLNRFAQADKSLRAALPLVKSEPAMVGATYFYLGVADYNLARATQDKVMMKAALGFSEEAYKLGGQFSQSASQNVYAIKQELTRMR